MRTTGNKHDDSLRNWSSLEQYFYVEDEKLVADALGSIENFIISTKND